MIFEDKILYDIRAQKCAGVGRQPFILGATAMPMWVNFADYKLPNGNPITGYLGIEIRSETGVLLTTITSGGGIVLEDGILYGDATTILTPFAAQCIYLQIVLTGIGGTITIRTDLYAPQGSCDNDCSYITISSYLNGNDCLGRYIGQSDDMSQPFSNELLIFGELSPPLPKFDFGDRIDDCTNGSTKVTEKTEAIGYALSYLAQKELASILAAGTVVIKEIVLTEGGVINIISVDKWTLQTTEPIIVREDSENTCNCLFDFGGEFVKCVCELDTCATQVCGVGLTCEYELYDTQVFSANQMLISPLVSFRFANNTIRNAYVAACNAPNASIVTVQGITTPFTLFLQSFNTTSLPAARALHNALAPINNYIPECLGAISPPELDIPLITNLTTQTVPITLTVSKVRLKYTATAVPTVAGVTPTITGFTYDNSVLYPTMVTQVGNELQVLPYIPPLNETAMNMTVNIDTGYCEGMITIPIQE